MFSRKFALPLTAISLVIAGNAQAGGLWLNEYNSWDMGRASAGSEAGTRDASAILHNIAAMSELDQSELVVGAGYISPNTEFDLDQGSIVNGNDSGGSAGKSSPSAAAFYVRPLNDKWTAGVAIVALSGAGLDYNNDWVGRFQAQEVDIIVAGLTPGVSYAVNDKLSIGVGAAIMYSSLDLKIAVPNSDNPVTGPEARAKVDGDDIQVAAHLGIHYKLSESTSIGAKYIDELEFEYDGDASIQPAGASVGVETKVPFSSLFRAGLRHDFNEQWTGHLSWGWENWSKMEDVILSTSSNGAVLPRNWEDTNHYAAGLEYRIDDRWTVQGGIAYDDSPVDAEDRTADMPMDEQIRYAFGLKHERDSGMIISGQFVYADYGDAEIDSARQPPLIGYTGEYKDNDIIFAALTFSWPMGHAR